MAPNVPAEIDVFSIPHSRMKELVDVCNEKVHSVDYRNSIEVNMFLKELKASLHEFKSHESIENLFIMDRLKNRLEQRQIYNSAVCNCHKDDCLNEMMHLVRDGKHLWKTTIRERIHYGHSLQKAFLEFVKIFLPHMEEEEEIFQPLLVEYFEYDELKVLNEIVLEQHALIQDARSKDNLPSPENELPIDINDICNISALYEPLIESQFDPPNETYCSKVDLYHRHKQVDLNSKVALNQCYIPNENDAIFENEKSLDSLAGMADDDVLLKEESVTLPYDVLINIFSYLKLPDLGNCAQVCCSWNEAVYSAPIWKELYPIQWARGIWESKNVHLNYALEDDATMRIEFGDLNAVLSVGERPLIACQLAEREKYIFNGMIYHLLPRVGCAVETLIMDSGLGVNSNLIRQMLFLCPNVTKLSASYTQFDHYSLKEIWTNDSLHNLVSLDLQGCDYVDDETLSNLSMCLYGLSFSVNVQYAATPYANICPYFNDRVCNGRKNSNGEKFCPSDTGGLMCCPDNLNFAFMNEGYRELIDKCESNSSTCNTTRETIEIEDAYRQYYKHERKSTLRYLNLSGCWRVTDYGLLLLMESGTLSKLESLNLSGCYQLSGAALRIVSECSAKLQANRLSYCDNIIDGPHMNRANACDTISHPLKICCRSGQ